MFKKPLELETNVEVIKTTLNYLGYGTRILVTYTKNPIVGAIFPLNFERVLGAMKEHSKNLSEDSFIDDDLYNFSREIYESLVFLDSMDNFNSKVSFSISLNLSKENILEDDYVRALQLLSRAGIFKIKSFKISHKEDNRKFIDFSEASSGQQCLALMLLGVASRIENGALICIDEPEISLHPEWQEEFIPLLENLFSSYEGCHFIIATHSPLILSRLTSSNSFALDLDKNCFIDLDNATSRSSDYQLATVFKAPGFKNEYLLNESLEILSLLSKSIDISPETKARGLRLISCLDLLEEKDPVFSLINAIKRVFEEV